MKKKNKKGAPFFRCSFSILLIVALVFSNHVTAQRNWSFEFRPGVNFATQKLGDADLKTGYGFEGTFAYKLMPHLGAYAGWSWNKFAADNSFMGSNVDFEETGYTVGLQFMHPIAKSKINYLLRGGAIYNHIETENSDGKVINDTGHGWGWQAGAGVAIPLGKRFMLTPEIRYRSLSRDMKFNEKTIPVDLNYISGGIGLSFSF
jgi:Outer membrane protein beta-barrel domain